MSASESGLELLSKMWQIYVIPDTHAYMCVAVKMICADADISVSYKQDGYYKDGCHCKTCTGIDPRDLSILRQNTQAKKAERDVKAACSIASEGTGMCLPE